MASWVLLNELSAELGSDDPAGTYRMFADTISTIKRQNAVSLLVSTASLHGVSLSQAMSLHEWGGQGANRDRWLLLLAALAGPPARCWDIRESLIDSDAEVSIAGVSPDTSNAAVCSGSLLASFDSDPSLRLDDLQATVTRFVGDDLVATEVLQPHAWCVDGARRILGRQPEVEVPSSGEELWNRREELFPHLEFLAVARSEVVGIPESWLRPLTHRLAELNRVTGAWDRLSSPTPTWESQVTGESASRRAQFWFDDGSEQHLFEMHARFTPGYGRVYFRVVRERGVLRIAHIGEHR